MPGTVLSHSIFMTTCEVSPHAGHWVLWGEAILKAWSFFRKAPVQWDMGRRWASAISGEEFTDGYCLAAFTQGLFHKQRGERESLFASEDILVTPRLQGSEE